MTNVKGKQYLVFAGDSYYAAGGWNDFVMASDDAQEAIKRAEQEVACPPPPGENPDGLT
ncbi:MULTISPECIES: hypothetical protein [unclassified Rhizobium]|uniref:hypothetical protein n=1 Tax=unclassified Rhizobium TaxID=2613769 RepID=UPI001374838E|nr:MULTISPECIES: hypothetical protein [unclassified Rhizobium]